MSSRHPLFSCISMTSPLDVKYQTVSIFHRVSLIIQCESWGFFSRDALWPLDWGAGDSTLQPLAPGWGGAEGEVDPPSNSIFAIGPCVKIEHWKNWRTKWTYVNASWIFLWNMSDRFFMFDIIIYDARFTIFSCPIFFLFWKLADVEYNYWWNMFRGGHFTA